MADKWWILSLFLLVTLLVHPSAQYTAYLKGRHFNGKIVLPDLMHDLLPHNFHLKRVGDYMFILLLGVFFLLTYQRGNQTDFFDWLKIAAFIFLFKSITMSVTTLPDSQGHCEYRGFLNSGGCNDLIFSCHTAMITMTLLFTSLLLPKKFAPLLVAYLLTAIYFIISTRNHYTVDVLLGLYIGTTMFLLKDRF